MKIKVDNCINCPFFTVDTDYEAVGYSHYATCGLADHLEQEPFIAVYDDYDENFELQHPDWCPLKKENFEIVYENNSRNN